jgi:diguanylate cyclase (GGDEF)-like protein
LNRRTFETRISELISISLARPAPAPENGAERRKQSGPKSHWLAVLDIDHFKKINDTYGHIYGDEVLLLFSGLMKKIFRNTDLLFRYGGEEFVVVLAPADESDAFMVFERFRQRVELFEFPQVGRVTVSMGMTKIRAEDHSTTVVEHADKALYYAKEHGRNQTCNYHQLIKAGILKEQRYEGDIELF